jgi:CheY-like chemotaxis protein
MHVLVVDQDDARRAKTCSWLLAKGCVVSERATPVGLAGTVADLRPDVLLIDLLMRGLAGTEWKQFASDRGANGTPIVIAYTPVLPKVLKAVVGKHFVLGVLRPTDRATEFSRSFDQLIVHLAPVQAPSRPGSGTRRIERGEESAPSSTRSLVG